MMGLTPMDKCVLATLHGRRRPMPAEQVTTGRLAEKFGGDGQSPSEGHHSQTRRGLMKLSQLHLVEQAALGEWLLTPRGEGTISEYLDRKRLRAAQRKAKEKRMSLVRHKKWEKDQAYDSMLEAIRHLSRQKCIKKNCGTVCLCGPCHAKRALGWHEEHGRWPYDIRRN